jgi:tRNA (guanine37-N1)-methyltransferase
MSKESFCLKVPKKQAERTLVLANKLGLINKSLYIKKIDDEDSILIPIDRAPETSEFGDLVAHVPEVELSKCVFAEKYREKTVAEILEKALPSGLLESLPKALDVVGDIAIIEIPIELEGYKDKLGQAILESHKNLRTVLAKIGAIAGTFRIRELEFIAGENKACTLHKEYGCSYYVDVAKAYFSPRLSGEHSRVAALVQGEEVVVDLFAGVGPFAIPVAKGNGLVRVFAVDINPDAVELLKKNIELNKVVDLVHPILGDARLVVQEKLCGVADRVIMNLPETATEFVDVACKAIKSSGGIVHFYGFVRSPDTLEMFQQRFLESVEKAGRKVEVFLYAGYVRNTAPFEWQVVLDVRIV